MILFRVAKLAVVFIWCTAHSSGILLFTPAVGNSVCSTVWANWNTMLMMNPASSAVVRKPISHADQPSKYTGRPMNRK